MPAKNPTPAALRLILIVSSFPKLSETFIVNKFLGLLERGWDVHVVCSASESDQWQYFNTLKFNADARSRVIRTWPHRPRWLAALLMPFAFSSCFLRNPIGSSSYLFRGTKRFGFGVLRRLYLDANIVALKPDVVHFEFGSLAVDRMHLKHLLGSKIIVSFRGYDLNLSGLLHHDYFRQVWEQADALHVLGEGLWQRARQRGCPPTKPHVRIPPAIDTAFFDPGNDVRAKASSDRPMRILSVGRLTWEKGYEYAVEAVRFLLDQGVRSELRIIGDGVMLEPLTFARHQLGVGKSVQFLGGLPRTMVRDEMLAADVFLHSSVSEGFGNAVIEAQAMGLPVVSSDAGGLPENVVDGETGFVVPRRDSQALADKLAALARDPDLRQRMGQAGRKRIIEWFQTADQIEAFDRLYGSVLPVALMTMEGQLDCRVMVDSRSTVPNEK
jgi:colanic acid/amylovoran biosynthesis glycosyltransferase